jgi:hypothetical protein
MSHTPLRIFLRNFECKHLATDSESASNFQ